MTDAVDVEMDAEMMMAGTLSKECLTKAAGLKVAVVGGGLAGLMAARTLAAWGVQVTVYEARAQVGGRVLSDSTFAKGRIVEAGAELIGSIHTRWCALAKEYGISLITRTSGDFFRGQQLHQRMILGRVLTPDEIQRVENEVRKVLRKIAEEAKLVIDAGRESEPWNQTRGQTALVAFDRMSVADALRTRHQVSDDLVRKALDLLLVNNNVAPLGDTSYLALLCLVRGGQTERRGGRPVTINDDPTMGYWDELEIYRCGEGCQSLALAIAADVHARRGCRVVRSMGVGRIDLRPRGGGVLVTARSTKDGRFDQWLREKFPTGPLTDTRRYDCVVFTAPPPVWDRVEIVPYHPKDTVKIMGSGPAVKFFSRVRNRFWVKDGFAPLGGSLDIGQVWEGTDNQMRVKGQDIVLNVFTGARTPTPDQYKRGLDQLYPARPGVTGSGYLANLVGTPLLVDWSRQPFIRTGYSSPHIGQVLTIGKRLNEPFADRLFFAGEHIQLDHFGYMEGAIRSGERAARRLVDHLCNPPPELVAGITARRDEPVPVS